MRLTPSRRRLLSTFAAAAFLGRWQLIGGPAALAATPLPALEVRQRWATGNSRLAPPAAAGRAIAFAGDRTIGLVDPDAVEPFWSTLHDLELGAAFRPRPEGRHLVYGGRGGIGCRLLADGTPLWRHRAESQTGVPLVTPELCCFGDGHAIVALDLATGAERWRYTGMPDTIVAYAPAAAADLVLAGSGDGRLYALEARTGALRWQLDGRARWQYFRQLHVAGEVLVAGSYKEQLVGIRIADGAVLWQFNAGNFINSHHVADGVAYLWSPTGWIFAIDTASGALLWRHQTTDYAAGGGNWAPVMAELVTAGDRLLSLDMANVLHVLDRRSGDESARANLPEPVRPAVLPHEAGLVFATAAGALILTETPGA